MKGELWQIINDYEPDDELRLHLANIQMAIQEELTEIYGANISYPHFLERKEDFHEKMRGLIRQVWQKRAL